jgi:hypothetical protein
VLHEGVYSAPVGALQIEILLLVKSIVSYWVMTLCSPVADHQRFGEMYRLHINPNTTIHIFIAGCKNTKFDISVITEAVLYPKMYLDVYINGSKFYTVSNKIHVPKLIAYKHRILSKYVYFYQVY